MIITQTLTDIAPSHWEEWVNSGVSPAIISLNVRSIYDSREVDKILSRNTSKRWQHSDDLVPCWQVSGLNPATWERTLEGVQVKPDTPVLNNKGRLQKYLGATGYGSAPLFLDNGIDGYWQTVAKEKSTPVFIAEGAKKAGAGLSNGYATISIPGVSTCRKRGRLHHSLELFTGFGRTFYLCFDNDVLQKRPVQNALISMARELSAQGSKVMVLELPPGDSKGMDDFIVNNGPDKFAELVANAKTIEEWRHELVEQWQQQLQEQGEERKSRMMRYYEIVQTGWGDGLRLNLLKNEIELNDEPLDLNHVRLRIALEFDVDVPLGDAQTIVEGIATRNAYSPIVEYLDRLAQRHPNIDTSILDDLATRYFGSSNDLHNIYMKKTLIAAVARARRPGIKHDTATVLVGRQGAFKSTFWRKLFGDDWFCDELGDANERDELMKLHRFWCLEWSEFETVYRRKDVSSLKKFMASTVDAFRTPYSRSVKTHPRSCVLVGTTNEEEILSDPTGSRRFWIIPVEKMIPIDLIVQERDRIWAAANALYEAGHQWWLTPQEGARQERENEEFQTDDPWATPIKDYLRNQEYVRTSEVLSLLSIEPSRQDVAAAKRVSCVLRRLGWKQGCKRINGEPVKVWRPDAGRNSHFFSELATLPDSDHLSVTTASNNTNQELPDHLQPQNQEVYPDHPQSYTQHSSQANILEGDPGDPDENSNFIFFQTPINSKVGSIEHQDENSDSSPQEQANEVIANAIKFEVNGIYWCQSQGKKAKIAKLFKTKPEAEVWLSGEIERFRVNLNELSSLPAGFAVADEVKVLAAPQHLTKTVGKQLKIDIIDGAGIWLRDIQKIGAPLFGPYQSCHLKKIPPMSS